MQKRRMRFAKGEGALLAPSGKGPRARGGSRWDWGGPAPSSGAKGRRPLGPADAAPPPRPVL